MTWPSERRFKGTYDLRYGRCPNLWGTHHIVPSHNRWYLFLTGKYLIHAPIVYDDDDLTVLLNKDTVLCGGWHPG